jgi:hypothetical protein
VRPHQVAECARLHVTERQRVVENLGRRPRQGAHALVALFGEPAGLQGADGLPYAPPVAPRDRHFRKLRALCGWVHFDTCFSQGITEKFMTGVMGQAVSQKTNPRVPQPDREATRPASED